MRQSIHFPGVDLTRQDGTGPLSRHRSVNFFRDGSDREKGGSHRFGALKFFRRTDLLPLPRSFFIERSDMLQKNFFRETVDQMKSLVYYNEQYQKTNRIRFSILCETNPYNVIK